MRGWLRLQEFLSFLRQIEKSFPADLDLHLLVDNDATHKHPKIPTYASWLNQVQRCSFSSVKELIARIKQFVGAYNNNTAPLLWTAMADSILEKRQRLCSCISGSAYQHATSGEAGVATE